MIFIEKELRIGILISLSLQLKSFNKNKHYKIDKITKACNLDIFRCIQIFVCVHE